MPRPVFGAADWFTFEELEDSNRFTQETSDAGLLTVQQTKCDELARAAFGDEADGSDFFSAYPTWPGVSFCVSRGTKTVLMVRRDE